MATPTTAVRPVPSPTPTASRLGLVQRGRQRAARRILIYGDGGLGKTTLAAGAPRPIWIDLNQGSLGFDVARYVFANGTTKPDDLEDVLAALRDIATAGDKDFETVVVDVLSDLEQLVWAATVANAKDKQKPANIEEVGGGFQKGYTVAIDEWRKVVNALEGCWRAGLHVVLIDHTDVKKEKNIAGADYGRGMPKIHPTAAKFLHTWCDYTFFLEVEKTLVPDSPDARRARKEYAISDGKRLLHARPAAEYMAKSRPQLADPIELPSSGGWQHIEEQIADARVRHLAELRASVEARIGGLGEGDAARARELLMKASDDDSKLEQLDNWCAARPARKE